MREILFRGKRSENGDWIEGSLVHQTDHYGDPVNLYYIVKPGNFHCDYYVSEEVWPETIGQYTGLTDKNGTKIFEGDIVRGLMDWGPAGMLETVVDIGFENSVGGYRWNYFDMDTIEVIGNVYDNPELLDRFGPACNHEVKGE